MRIATACFAFMFLVCANRSHASDEWTGNFAWNVTNYYPGTTQISWTLDESDISKDSGITLTNTLSAINSAFSVWDNVQANYSFMKKADLGGAYDFLDSSNWNYSYANIVFGGWINSTKWAQINGNPNNIAGSWPFTIRDAQNNRVDYDGNGYYDLAQVVIFFNDAFEWSTDGSANKYDIQTVAVHEIGHALGLHHSPTGVSSVMMGITGAGQLERTFFQNDWAIGQIQSLYPAAVPEPSAVFLFLFGLILTFKQFNRK